MAQHTMATRRVTRSMARLSQSANGSSTTPPSDSSGQEPVTSISSIEPIEPAGFVILLDDPSETAGSEMLVNEPRGAPESEILLEEACDAARSEFSLDSPKSQISLAMDPVYNMDVGEFLKDRLDGHVKSYPYHTTPPWPTGVYPAVPGAYAAMFEDHEVLWAGTCVIEKKKLKSKPQSLANLEKTLIHFRSRGDTKKGGPQQQQKQSRAFKQRLRAQRSRLERLDIGVKRVTGTVTEIYAKRSKGYHMNNDERKRAKAVEERAWRIRVSARGVRRLRSRASEYEELTQNLKEIILLEIARNNTHCVQLREMYQSVIWGEKGWKVDVGLAENHGKSKEWDSEDSEVNGELDESDDSNDTEDESEDDHEEKHQTRSNPRSHKKIIVDLAPKRVPFIKLVVSKGSEESTPARSSQRPKGE
ncbi:hypothetical protein L873DRAFT_1821465 [Choiromyces venosus 120613-1]|uniref:Uncharacterized protein n=1 Tax=Choiromyces venosus 120613-1 TaxID=1336337 RepID=A0A3N4IZM3_9PEZI|nr:hypothetical protein L873DRAFT_1821465 [Choiromyces venosus 120613-1]